MRQYPVTQNCVTGITSPIASHSLVIGTTAAFRGNPGDVAVGILGVAGLAVNAVLGVDLVTRSGGFFDPLIDPGRAIAVRRTGVDIVLRGLLQGHVGDLEMDRLIL